MDEDVLHSCLPSSALSMFINVESRIKDKIIVWFITKETPKPSDPIGLEQNFGPKEFTFGYRSKV